MPKVFLDKLVTSAHMPRAEGSRGYTSKTTFPDLSHTMISTSFCPAGAPAAMTPKGEFLRTYRHHAFMTHQKNERPAASMKRKPKFFKRAHNVFANKVLMDLEAMKRTRNERRQQIWEAGKKSTGFEDLERSSSNNMDMGGMSRSTAFESHGFDAPEGEEKYGHTYGGSSGGAAARNSHGGLAGDGEGLGPGRRPATTQSGTDGSRDQPSFFNKSASALLQPSATAAEAAGGVKEAGSAGAAAEEFGADGDFFELAPDFNPSGGVQTTLPAALADDNYGDDAFELMAPSLEATMPADFGRPNTSLGTTGGVGGVPSHGQSESKSGGGSGSGSGSRSRGSSSSAERTTSSGRPRRAASPTDVHEDPRVGMHSRLSGSHNPLIAAEEAKYQKSKTCLGDVAFFSVGKAEAKRAEAVGSNVNTTAGEEEKEASLAEEGSLTVLTDEQLDVGSVASRASISSRGSNGSRGSFRSRCVCTPPASPQGSRGNSPESRRGGPPSGLAPPSHSRRPPSGSPGGRGTPKHKDGLPPPRARKGFSRATYFECLLDSLDIPKPNAPRFGMVTSPNKTKRDRRDQRRAQTAGFSGTYDSPINIPDGFVEDERGPYEEQGEEPLGNPLQAEAMGDLVGDTYDADPDAGVAPLMDALTGAIESNLALEHREDFLGQTRPLTAADMKSVLQRMAVSRQKSRSTSRSKANKHRAPLKGSLGEHHALIAPRSPISATSRHKIVPTEKWHPDGVERALTGDKYGQYKARQYR